MIVVPILAMVLIVVYALLRCAGWKVYVKRGKNAD
jgi:hypothetical protein